MPRPVAIRRGRRMRDVSSHVAPRPTGMPVRVLVLVVAAVIACWLAYGQRNARLQADGLALVSAQPPQFQKARDLFTQASAFSFSRDREVFIATTDWYLGHRAKALAELRAFLRDEPDRRIGWVLLRQWAGPTDPAVAAEAAARIRAITGGFGGG